MTDEKANEPAVSTTGSHDRVAMLSLHADGSHAQTSPEFIVPKDDALASSTRQFVEQSVSAKDQELRGVVGEDDTEKDIDTLAAAHEAAAESGTAAAKSVVDELHK